MFWHRFVAIIFGRPALINEVDIQVQYPGDLDDGLARCPGFESTEVREDGLSHPVTIYSYMRLRGALYRIAAPICRDMYARKDRAKSDLVSQVDGVHKQLLEWERTIPPELRLTSFPRYSQSSSKVSKIFQVQALALQISYDNIQLLLHRPLLSLLGRHGRPSRPRPHNTGTSEKSIPSEPGFDLEVAQTSKQQCWASAMRTSMLVENTEVWEAASKSPLGSHIGILAFTAGVMLATFALSNPLSSQAQDAKHGIARIIRLPTLEGYRAPPIWPQSTRILENLLRLILAEEMKALLSGTSRENAEQTGLPLPLQIENKTQSSEGSSRLVQEYTEQRFAYAGDNRSSTSYANNNDNALPVTAQYHPWAQMQVESNTFPTPDGDFEDALLSLQTGESLQYPFNPPNLNKAHHFNSLTPNNSDLRRLCTGRSDFWSPGRCFNPAEPGPNADVHIQVDQ